MFVLCCLDSTVLELGTCVKAHDNRGLYVGSVGWSDIHCKFLSTFRGCVLTSKFMCISYMLHICLWHIQYCEIIIFDWYLVMSVFCLRFVYKFHPPVESVYSFHTAIFPSHIIFPLPCGLNLQSIFYSVASWVWPVINSTLLTVQLACWAGYIKPEILETEPHRRYHSLQCRRKL